MDLSVGTFVSRGAPYDGGYVVVNPMDEPLIPAGAAGEHSSEEGADGMSPAKRLFDELHVAQAAYLAAEREVFDLRLGVLNSLRQRQAAASGDALADALAKRDIAENLFGNVSELLRGGGDESQKGRKLSGDELLQSIYDLLGISNPADFEDALFELWESLNVHQFWRRWMPSLDKLKELMREWQENGVAWDDCVYYLGSAVFAFRAAAEFFDSIDDRAFEGFNVILANLLHNINENGYEIPESGSVLSALIDMARKYGMLHQQKLLEQFESFIREHEAGDMILDGFIAIIELAMWRKGKVPSIEPGKYWGPKPVPKPRPQPEPDPGWPPIKVPPPVPLPPIKEPPPVTLPPVPGKPMGSIWEEFVKSIEYGKGMLGAYERWFSQLSGIYDEFIRDVYTQLGQHIYENGNEITIDVSKIAWMVEDFFSKIGSRPAASAESKDQLKKFFDEIGVNIPDRAFKYGPDGWYVEIRDIPGNPVSLLFDGLKAALLALTSGRVPDWESMLERNWVTSATSADLARLTTAIESAMSRFEENLQIYAQKYADTHSRFENLHKTLASLMQIMADMGNSILRNL